MARITQLHSRDVLLVVDVQNDLLPGGALPVPGADAVLSVINRYGDMFRHVVLTQTWHPRAHRAFASNHPGRSPWDVVRLPYGDQTLWPEHCIAGTPGADFPDRLNKSRAELILRRGTHVDIGGYSAFYENDRKTPTGLGGYLREREVRRLFVVGLAGEFGVLHSALDARKAKLETWVLEDAVRGFNLQGSMESAWRALAKIGVNRSRESDLVLS